MAPVHRGEFGVGGGAYKCDDRGSLLRLRLMTILRPCLPHVLKPRLLNLRHSTRDHRCWAKSGDGSCLQSFIRIKFFSCPIIT
jgi:hypothetical protein